MRTTDPEADMLTTQPQRPTWGIILERGDDIAKVGTRQDIDWYGWRTYTSEYVSK